MTLIIHPKFSVKIVKFPILGLKSVNWYSSVKILDQKRTLPLELVKNGGFFIHNVQQCSCKPYSKSVTRIITRLNMNFSLVRMIMKMNTQDYESGSDENFENSIGNLA